LFFPAIGTNALGGLHFFTHFAVRILKKIIPRMMLRILLIIIYVVPEMLLGQSNASYLKANAIEVKNPVQLSDSVYNLFSSYQVFMVGEMHGANECAEFVTGLAALFTGKGDSVSVGFEIPESQMQNFISSRTDSSIYQSSFFSSYQPFDGRESFAWARAISHLKNNPGVRIFFFDVNDETEKKSDRDSMMYLKIKKQFQLHPRWKLITLSGNAHAIFTAEEKKTASYIRQDEEMNGGSGLCTIYNFYLQGSCNANFGGTFEERNFNRPMNDWDTVPGFDKYVILLSSKTTLPYTAVYYTRNMTPSKMVKGNFNLAEIKNELKQILERDQKTRTGSDSSAFMSYIDSCLQEEVKLLILKYGWMGKSLVGDRGNQALFLVIQHATLSMQEKYFPCMQQSVDEGESRADEIAMLEDRILMRQGKNQKYGSQVVYSKTGEQIFYPIADEKNVNVRRAKAGMQPMEEYAKYFGINYKIPDH
jgi:hypothetical protein